MAVDQATRLRELAQSARSRAMVVAVTSGKGGVGKSNIALNLAAAAARAKRRVYLVDADLGLANLDLLCGVTPSCGLAEVVAGRRRLLDVAVRTPSGVNLIAGANGIAYLADLPDEDRMRLLAGLQTLEREADLIVIDTGAGISRNVIKVAAAADECLVVTTAEPTSITDAYAVLKLVSREREHGAMSLVVNQADSAAHAERIAARVMAVARQFLKADVSYAGCVPSDPNLPRAVRSRMPVSQMFPSSASSVAISSLAGRYIKAGAVEESRGFISRLKSLVGR